MCRNVRMGVCVSKPVPQERVEEAEEEDDDDGEISPARTPIATDNTPVQLMVEGNASSPEKSVSRITGKSSENAAAAASSSPGAPEFVISTTMRQVCKIMTVPTKEPHLPQPVGLILPINDSASCADVSESVASVSDSIIAHKELSPTVSGEVIPLRIVARLGNGMDARVYSARRVETNTNTSDSEASFSTHLIQSEEVAVKVSRRVPKISSEMDLHKQVDGTGEPDSDARAQDESRIVSMLKDHPNVIKIFTTLSSQNHVYQVLERCVGDLVDVVKRFGVPSEVLLVRWTYQIVSAVAYAHQLGIVHGDIKPDNVLLRKDGSIAVSDWGFARDAQNEASPHCRDFHATMNYAPPELLQGMRGKSREADAWAVGCLVYGVAYNTLPFGEVKINNPASIARVCIEPVEFKNNIRKTSIQFKLFINAAMEKRWRNRKTMKELLRHPWLAPEASVYEEMNRISMSINTAPLDTSGSKPEHE